MAAQSPVHPQTSSVPASASAVPYDFRRPDRIPADHLRVIQSVHENFARALGSSLSAYLRTFVSVGSARIERLSFAEFSRRAARPVATVALRMRPQEASAVLQLSHSALFPMLEILLGGTGKSPANIDREITEIERSIFSPLLRIVVQELKSAWRPVSPIEFVVEDEATARQILSSMAPGQELLAIALEVDIGEANGVLHLGLPCRAVQALLQDRAIGKSEPQAADCAKMLRLIQRAQLNAEVRLNGPKMLLRDLLEMEPGDVLTFDHPLSKEVELELNGTSKFEGHIVAAGNRRAFQVKRPCQLETVRTGEPV
ncbi:MAG TPA: FliM/FliN family flagellar motor switch protein [Bryobacteraceae bacterium]|jgi:flagellar motor switch protein FliM|nr:FliM/FliN family flagellar motor switch protein [Bryobacteraceae bacterium]